MWPPKWLRSNHPYHSKVISNKKLCKIKELLWASSWECHYHVLPSAFTSSEMALNSVMYHVPRISFIAQFHKELFVFLPLLLDYELLKWTDWLRIIHLSKSSNLHTASNQVEAQKILAPLAWNHLFFQKNETLWEIIAESDNGKNHFFMSYGACGSLPISKVFLSK